MGIHFYVFNSSAGKVVVVYSEVLIINVKACVDMASMQLNETMRVN